MTDDFDREVYCIGGLPFDAISQQQAIEKVYYAVNHNSPCFISTPNLDFIIASKSDENFRDSVINSDLSVADGMPIVWLARLMKIPVRERIAGSSLFESLGREQSSDKNLSVFFFGGNPGVAQKACSSTKHCHPNLKCVGYIDPGFVSVEDMSRPEYLEDINTSGADFLVIALGSKKGQAWIEKNFESLNVPVVSHLGAVINFVAGTVKRAPVILQKTGFEWLWRIKEEPALWKRYWNNAVGLGGILFRSALPYALYLKKHEQFEEIAKIRLTDSAEEVVITLSGAFSGKDHDKLGDVFRQAIVAKKDVTVDFNAVSCLDSSVVGSLLLLRKHINKLDKRLKFRNISGKVRPVFDWCGATYLLDEA